MCATGCTPKSALKPPFAVEMESVSCWDRDCVCMPAQPLVVGKRLQLHWVCSCASPAPFSLAVGTFHHFCGRLPHASGNTTTSIALFRYCCVIAVGSRLQNTAACTEVGISRASGPHGKRQIVRLPVPRIVPHTPTTLQPWGCRLCLCLCGSRHF